MFDVFLILLILFGTPSTIDMCLEFFRFGSISQILHFLMEVLFVLLNFFYLDEDNEKCAEYHGNKHLTKMQVEYAQIGSTVFRAVSKGEVPEGIYKSTHVKHPVVLWAQKSRANVMRIIDVGIALEKERLKRKKVGNKTNWVERHASQNVLELLKEIMPGPEHFEEGDKWSEPPQCVPDFIRNLNTDVIDAYRLTYAGPKSGFLKWDYAEVPPFIEGCRKRLRDLVH